MNNSNAQSPVQFKKAPIVAALLIGAFVAILNQTLMNIALPKIMEDLAISANTVQWLTTGFLLVNGVLIPITAYLVEKYTTRQLFITSMILFALGTLLCAVSPNFAFLLIGRLVQAAGAGILMPLMTVVFLNIFPIEKRGQAMGTMGIAMLLAPAIGPTLSGWVIEHHSWRVLFYIILPIAIISIILGIVFLKNVTRVSNPTLDKTGVLLSTIGFGGLLYGFSDAGNVGWSDRIVIASLIAGVISLILFIIRELKVEHPILEFRIFKYDMFTLTTAVNMIITMALYAGMILLPIYLLKIRGFSPFESGLLLMPGAIVMGIMSPITGTLFDKIGARWLAVVGLAITVGATWEFSRLTVSSTYTHLLIVYTVRSFGMSMLMMPIQTAGLNQLPRRLNSHGTAMSNTLRMMAGAVGTALLVTIFTNHTKDRVKELIISTGANPKDLAQMAKITKEATVTGINYAFVVATWITAAALVLSFFIQKRKPADESISNETGVTTESTAQARG
ncbi:DHA2 family efflux MFS transporter permease subunit [Paenibacillus sediminis]|uniref:EmrB/QacA subfamily drug resistance transporter n=1 Tax=Paenibacillus sediminis TaxID=664909 RepID=A0ABS4H066_9BACL|nr:DHA2 family efflux MFS transporter permease subunit [Paenibacillus sediminis]MBP1935856.1 EmrB/QacA subfamily drug resistance transporter [Paenibacillus sediminis]